MIEPPSGYFTITQMCTPDYIDPWVILFCPQTGVLGQLFVSTFRGPFYTVNYRDMGHGMGQQDFLKIQLNYLTQKTKEKFRNHGGFGTFMVAEAGLEPTTSGL